MSSGSLLPCCVVFSAETVVGSVSSGSCCCLQAGGLRLFFPPCFPGWDPHNSVEWELERELSCPMFTLKGRVQLEPECSVSRGQLQMPVIRLRTCRPGLVHGGMFLRNPCRVWSDALSASVEMSWFFFLTLSIC